MVYRKRSAEEKQELVAAWRESGLTKTRYARESGVSPSVFSRWLERVEGSGPARSGTFLPVRVVAPPADRVVSSLVVHVGGSGHRVEVPEGFDAAHLRAVVGALC